jgi:hypothetical protein
MASRTSARLAAGLGAAALALAAVPVLAAPASATESCTFAHLATRIAAVEGAAGSQYVTLRFTNIGNSTCTVYGHPGVSLYKGADRRQVGLTAQKANDTNLTVKLRKGQSADAVLRIANALNYPKSTCRPKQANGLRIIPPQHYSSVYLPFPVWTCKKPVRTMTINAVRHSS